MATEKQKKTRRRHTPEFRAGAVKLVVEEGRSAAQVGADLGVHRSLIASWVRQARVDGGKGPACALTTDEKAELAALRKEVRVLQMERAIVRNAAAFFAKENA